MMVLGLSFEKNPYHSDIHPGMVWHDTWNLLYNRNERARRLCADQRRMAVSVSSAGAGSEYAEIWIIFMYV